MRRLFTTSLFCILCACMLNAQNKNSNEPIKEKSQTQQLEAKVPAIIQSYMNLWEEASYDKRSEQIKLIWAENGTYEDAAAKTKGTKELNDMIEKFRSDFPNTMVSFKPVLTFRNYHTWSWTFINQEKNLNLDGRDYVELNADGKIVKLVGFWGKE